MKRSPLFRQLLEAARKVAFFSDLPPGTVGQADVVALRKVVSACDEEDRAMGYSFNEEDEEDEEEGDEPSREGLDAGQLVSNLRAIGLPVIVFDEDGAHE